MYFEVLSYAGTLAITAIIDPEHFRSIDALTNALSAELELIMQRDPSRT